MSSAAAIEAEEAQVRAAEHTTPIARSRRTRPRLEAVRQGDALLMTAGTLGSGVLAYVFNVLAARSLGPEAYGAVGALWGGMFLLAVLLFRPVEQTLSRSVADHVARGADARPVVRTTAWLALALTLAVTVACVLAWQPLTDGLFGGRDWFTAALVVGVAGYGASYFARGVAGGVRWFGGYGLVLLADGAIRVVVALPLLFVASPAIAAVAIAAAAGGGAIAPLLSRSRGRLRTLAADGEADFALGSAARFAVPAAVIAGSEQVLISGGPILVLLAGGPGAEAAAGVLFAATLLVRAPVFLFQGVAASLLPSLTTFRAHGDEARVLRATITVAVILAGFSAAMALVALVAGPTAMEILYGADFTATAGDLALLAAGIGAFLAAGTFCQAVLARAQAGRAALAWSAAAVTFVALELSLSGSTFHRVSVAFAAASALVAVLLLATVLRHRT